MLCESPKIKIWQWGAACYRIASLSCTIVSYRKGHTDTKTPLENATPPPPPPLYHHTGQETHVQCGQRIWSMNLWRHRKPGARPVWPDFQREYGWWKLCVLRTQAAQRSQYWKTKPTCRRRQKQSVASSLMWFVCAPPKIQFWFGLHRDRAAFSLWRAQHSKFPLFFFLFIWFYFILISIS